MTILGMQVMLPDWLAWMAEPVGKFLVNLLAWALLSFLADLLTRAFVRRVARRTDSSLDDTIASIVRRPLVALLAAFGALASWELAFGDSPTTDTLQRLHNSVLIVLGAYVAWRVLYEVVIADLKPRVQQTDSQADDIIIPILRRIGPVIIVIAVANAVVSALGGNLGTLMAGLGLLGLVLGYVFQEPLQGLFAGTYMALDNPFHEDDLLILEDGSACQVQAIGVRVTQLYDVRRHVLMYIPNAKLAASRIVNITKPSVEMRSLLTVNLRSPFDAKGGIALLEEACNSHENVLGDWRRKEPAIKRRREALAIELAALRELPAATPARDARCFWLEDHLSRLDGDLIRLQVEHSLRERGESFGHRLLDLFHACSRLVDQGALAENLPDIRREVQALMDDFDTLIEQITVWLYLVRAIESELTDDSVTSSISHVLERGLLSDGRLALDDLAAHGLPGAPTRPVVQRQDLRRIRSSDMEAEKAADHTGFRDRAAFVDYRRLYGIWHRNITLIYRGLEQILALVDEADASDTRLLNKIRSVERTFADAFLLRVSYWQLPSVKLLECGGADCKFEVSYFVDDVVREHFQRMERVTTELWMEVERLRRAQESP